MLEAEERDNRREREREAGAEERNRVDMQRINEARFIPQSAGSRNRRGSDRGRAQRQDEKARSGAEEALMTSHEQSYFSSSIASSFDYRALTDEEKQRILGGAQAAGAMPGGVAKVDMGPVGQAPTDQQQRQISGIGINLAAVKENNQR